MKTTELGELGRKLLNRQRAFASDCRIPCRLSFPTVVFQFRTKNPPETKQSKEWPIQRKQSNQVFADRTQSLHFAIREDFEVEPSVIRERVNKADFAIVAIVQGRGRPLGALPVVTTGAGVVEIRGHIFQVLELGAAVGTKVINLHRLKPAHFSLVRVAIDAPLGAVLGNLVLVVGAIVRVGVVFSSRPLRVGGTPREAAEKLRLYRFCTHGSQIQVFVLQLRSEFGDGLFERLGIVQFCRVLRSQTLRLQ